MSIKDADIKTRDLDQLSTLIYLKENDDLSNVKQQLDYGLTVVEKTNHGYRLGEDKRDAPATPEMDAKIYILQEALDKILDRNSFSLSDFTFSSPNINQKNISYNAILDEQREFYIKFEELFPLIEYPKSVAPRAVLLLTGLGKTHITEYSEHIELFKSKGIDVYYVDFPEYGSKIPDTKRGEVYDFDNLAIFVMNKLEIMREEAKNATGKDPFVGGINIIGQSLGGLVAAKIAQRLGSKTEQKKLINSIITTSGPFSASWEKKDIPSFYKIVESIGFTYIGNLAEILKVVLCYIGILNEKTSEVAKFSKENKIISMCKCYAGIMYHTNWEDICKDIEVPMVSIVGKSDGALYTGGHKGVEHVKDIIEVYRPWYGHKAPSAEFLLRVLVSTDVRTRLINK